MAKRKVGITYDGVLVNVSEQGLEHHSYALHKDGFELFHWEGVELIDDGDELIVFDKDGRELYRGKIKMVFDPEGPLTQRGLPWQTWHSFFYPRDKILIRAKLTKFIRPTKNKK